MDAAETHETVHGESGTRYQARAELWASAPAPAYTVPTPFPTEFGRAIHAVALDGRRPLDFLLATLAFE